jgi:hypothetical protein
MKTHLLLLALVAITVLRGGSCLKVTRPYPTPKPQDVLAALKARGAALSSYRGEARMSFNSPQGKIKASVRMMAAKGGHLRFDVVSPIDAPLSTLVTSNGEFALLDSRENRHYYGPASPCNLARLLMVALTPTDVLAALGGAVPTIKHDSATLRWDDRAGQEVLTLVGAKQIQTIRLDGRDRSWRVLSSEMRSKKGGRVQLALAFGQYRKAGKLVVPATIAVRQPRRNAELELAFKRQETNISLPKAAFERPQAGGLPSRRVSCDPPPAGLVPASQPKASSQPTSQTSTATSQQ